MVDESSRFAIARGALHPWFQPIPEYAIDQHGILIRTFAMPKTYEYFQEQCYEIIQIFVFDAEESLLRLVPTNIVDRREAVEHLG